MKNDIVEAPHGAQLLFQTRYVEMFGVLASGVGIALYYCWRLGLVMLGGLPLMVVGGMLENIAMFQNPNKVDPTYAKVRFKETQHPCVRLRVCVRLRAKKKKCVRACHFENDVPYLPTLSNIC